MDVDSKVSESVLVDKTNNESNQSVPSSYPLSIFLRKEKAIAFACVKCKNVPRNSMNTEDGDLLCEKCTEDFNGETSPGKYVQKMINNLKIICINNCSTFKESKKGEKLNTEGMICITNNDEKCEWTGKVKDWSVHNEQECEYALISCEHCLSHECIRKSMSVHLSNDCINIVVECPLNCSQSMKRYEQESHVQNDCKEYLLQCQNIGCNLKIKRHSIDTHMDSECDQRLVSCPFSNYGCNINANSNGLLPYCELKQHMIDCTMDHLHIKLDFVMNRNEKMVDDQNFQSEEIQRGKKAQQTLIKKVFKLESSQIKMKQENTSLKQTIFQLESEQNILQSKTLALIEENVKLKIEQNSQSNRILQLEAEYENVRIKFEKQNSNSPHGQGSSLKQKLSKKFNPF